MTETPWWELPLYPYRPQHLLLTYLLQERQPPLSARQVEVVLAHMEE